MPSKPVFGFYGSWATYRNGVGKCDVNDINPNLCTHLIYAFAGVDGSGSIVHKDAHCDLPNGNDGMRCFNNLRNRNPGLKTLVSIGGHGNSSTFPTVAGNEQLRQTFARNARDFCRTHGFNGVDIDWEFPESSYDHGNLVRLLTALSRELHAAGLLLTTSVGINRPYDMAGVARNVDYVLLMTYDYNGSWDSYTGHNAPLFAGSGESEYQRNLNIDHSVKCWARDAPKSKLIVGLAAYGRTWRLSSAGSNGVRVSASGPGQSGEFTGESGTLAYYEVMRIPDLRRRWDSEQRVPYGTFGHNQWVSYDDEESIRGKCEYIKRNGLGGAMVWSIDQDAFQGGKFTLLSTVARCL
uniref:GH18 domain-containing protein n=1 Tax=Anopheles farauti TaxID=69004 RepID=A0A182Q8A9_9DIPT